MRVMNKIGDQLIARGKRHILGLTKNEDVEEDDIEKDRMADTVGRNLLTALLRANMDIELPDSQRLTDKAIRGRALLVLVYDLSSNLSAIENITEVPTFLVAGHETSSTQTTWTLFALASPRYHNIQSKLREELFSVETDTPSLDQLNELPYLDAVVRESLRLYPAVTSTIRVAARDDVIPVSKPFVDRKGKIQTSIRVQKGESMVIPIHTAQRYKELWGEDAKEFK